MLGTFLTWTSENTTTTIGFMKDLIFDLTPLLTIIIAIGLGLLIFEVVISTIRGRT